MNWSSAAGNLYTRNGGSNQKYLQEKLAFLEGRADCIVLASGVANITRVGASRIGILPTPLKTGYPLDGGYTDAAPENPFEERLQPKQNMSLFANGRQTNRR